jgi:hypothetical protein
MVTSTSLTREIPLLEAIYALESAEASYVSIPDLVTTTGLSQRDVRLGFDALVNDDYIHTGNRMFASGGWQVASFPRLTGKGRRAVGQWPDDGYSALVALLDSRIAGASTDEERSRLVRLRDALIGVGRDVGVSIVTAWSKSVLGLP